MKENFMTKNERIEMLARLAWDYMEELNKVNAESLEIERKINNDEPDADILTLKLIDRRMERIREKFIYPLSRVLSSEGVQLMKMEDGKLKLLMKDKRELVVDIEGLEPCIERFL